MLSYIEDKQFTWSCTAHTLFRRQGAPKVKEPTVNKNHGLTKYNCETESNRSKKKMVFGVVSLFFLFGARHAVKRQKDGAIRTTHSWRLRLVCHITARVSLLVQS